MKKQNSIHFKTLLTAFCILSSFAACKSSSSSTASATPTPSGGSTATPTPTPTPTPYPSGTAAKFKIQGPASGTTNTCFHITVNAIDGSGANISSNADVNIYLNDASTQQGQFFTDSACSSSSIVTTTFLTGQNTLDLYYYNAFPNTLNLHADIISGGVVGTSYSITLTPIAISTVSLLQISGAGTTCRKLQLGFIDANATSVVESESTTTPITMSVTGSGTTNFYSDAGCSVAITSLTVGVGSAYAPLFYVGSNTHPQTFNMNFTYAGHTFPTTFYFGP